MTPHVQAPPAFPSRFAIYLHERFPPLQYAAGLGALVWATLGYARALHGETGFPPGYPALVAFSVTFLLFLQLRILDEFKDFEEDARFRPYRPVPRGLVSLRSLFHVWLAAAAVETMLAASLGTVPLGLLLLILAYSGLMRVEFFLSAWLKHHALAYMISHMLIVPLIVLFIVSCLRLPTEAAGLAPFLAFAYLNFCVFEIGRKIRAPAEEETGVETYSALWGMRAAITAWLGVIWSAAAAGAIGALQIGIATPYLVVAVAVAAASTARGVRFLRHPDAARGESCKTMSGTWQLAAHLVFGAATALMS